MTLNKEDLKNKIIYRASYRGTKEMDILMTAFVKSLINDLDENFLKTLDSFVDMDDETLISIKKKESFLCVGLDTDIDKIPSHVLECEDPIFEFNKQIIDATKDYCVAYKPNTAFYECHGAKGWETLKNCGASSKLNKEDLVFIAVRDTEKPEDEFIERNNIKIIKVEEVRNTSGTAAANEALSYLNKCDIIYVSFDVDSMDCDLISYGTGTPVKDGLTDIEAKDILRTLIQSEKVVCFETVEINPCLDNKTNKMAEVAFDILENTINTFAKK